MTDLELLKQYGEGQSQEAFAELVGRHLEWVYGAAARRVHDRELAEDVAQGVFLALARRARAKSLGREQALSPWLLRVTRCAAISALRAVSRRQRHEQKAAAMRPESTTRDSEAQWEEVAPLLDDQVLRLGKNDQQAILLRFYERKSLAEVGNALGISEEAARKRVDRAVEKLRGMLGKKGITGTTAGLSAVLVGNVVERAPASLVEGVMKAIGGGNPVASAIAKGAMKMMKMATLKVVAVVSIVALMIGVPVTVVALAQPGETPPSPSSAVALPTTNAVGANELADAIAAARSRYPELTMAYVSDDKVGDAKGVQVGTRVQEVTLARRQPTAETFLDIRQTYKDVVTGNETVERDEWAVFDGKSTRSLQRRGNGPGFRNAQVTEGKAKAVLLTYPMDDPEWFWQPRLADGLRRKDVEVSITEGEVIDGVRTVKAVLSHPELTTTIWVAPDRSYLPLRVRTALKRTDIFPMQFDIGQLVQLENGQWFPKLVTYHFGDPQQPSRQFRFKEVSTKHNDGRFSTDFSHTPAVAGGPKAALIEMAASVVRLDASGIIDGCVARTTDETEFVASYAESLVAMERYRHAMENRFGVDERYSRIGIGSSLALLPLEQSTEKITGENASITVITSGSRCLTLAIPMKLIAGRWRLPVNEMWDAGQKLMAADGAEIPPMKAVSEACRKTTPAYQRVADLVRAGTYSSKDDAMKGLAKEMAKVGRD